MSRERLEESDPRIQQAVAELQALIAARYPTATFSVGPGGENPEGTYLTACVNLDDPDAVLDLVIDRVLELQIEEHLPIHVVPVRTPERVERLLRERHGAGVPAMPPRYR